MKKFTSKIALVLAFILGVTTMAGCSKGVDTADNGKVVLRFSTWNDAESIKDQEAVVKRFNDSQEKIEVIVEAYGGDYDTKITAGMGAGDAPDIMYMWNYPAYSNGLEPLNSYIEKEGDEYKNNFYEALWNYNSIDGNVYGIPVSAVTLCLYYNKDIFDRAGLEYPTSNWTWTDLEENSRIIKEKVEGVYGFTFPMKFSSYQFEMFLWSNGTSYVDESGNLDGKLNSPQSIEVFKMFQDMTKESIALASETRPRDNMAAKTTAMVIDGTWPLQKFKDADVNFGVVQIPMFEGQNKSVSVLHTSGIAISKDSDYKEEAWEFVKYWTSEELNKERIGRELPALKSVAEGEKLTEDEIYGRFYDTLDNSAGYTPASFIVDSWTETDENLVFAIESIFNPSSLQDPETVLNDVVKN